MDKKKKEPIFLSLATHSETKSMTIKFSGSQIIEARKMEETRGMQIILSTTKLMNFIFVCSPLAIGFFTAPAINELITMFP